jgi:hypothetical protein
MDALLPQPLGFVTPRLYTIATAEQNHTKAPGLVLVSGESGSTCNPVASGWNTATGWGTPRAGLLYEDLIGTYVNVTLHDLPPEVAPAGTLDFSVEVLNATSKQPIVGLPVQLELSATPGYLGPCGGTLASEGVTTGPGGNASAGLPVSACYLGSAAVVSVTVLADGYFGNLSSTVQVNLLGLAGFLAVAQVFPYNLLLFAGIMTAAIALGLGLGRVRRRRAARRRISGPSPQGIGPSRPTGAPAAPPPPVDSSNSPGPPPGAAGGIVPGASPPAGPSPSPTPESPGPPSPRSPPPPE